MAGHSKWANIKHRKEKADSAKGKVFSRATKEIISAVKQGGADPKANPKLKIAIQKAKEVNLPNDNIDRNIKKALSKDQGDFYEMTYELYGHGGVGLIIDVITDNKNRIASDMRIATNKKGGSVASPGSVAFNFEKKGFLQIPKDAADEDDLFLLATDAGADDFEAGSEGYIVITPPDKLYDVKEKLENVKIKIQEAYLEMIPKATVECDDETKKANLELIDWIENLDDVDAVYHNMFLD